MTRKTVLVLGASGKLGALVRSPLMAFGAEDFDFKFVFRTPHPHADVVWSPDGPYPDGLRCDAILALWGVTSGTADALEMNTKLALRAKELARFAGATQVLHCSSVAVYGPQTAPCTETTQPAATAPYGLAKRAMEEAIDASPVEGLTQTCLRIGNVAGADSLFGSIKRGPELTLDRFGDGTGPFRAYIAPSDFARVACALLRSAAPLPRVINVAAPALTAMDAIARAAGCRIAWRDAPEGALHRLEIDTALLSRFVSLPETSADADWLVQDWKAQDPTA